MTDRFMMGAQLALPRAAATQKLAFLGVSGSGKTYGAGVFVEGLLSVGAQVVVIDTVGNWWGLRVGADGKRPSGIDIPVIGGDKGDLPLAPDHGEVIATAIAQTTSSMVIDISDFADGDVRRFVTAFAKTLLAAKKRNPSPVMVVWEECQDIIPQSVYGEDAKMVGAVQRLIKRGRNYGIGCVLISQRSAAVNKGCLNQIETMFAFRCTAPLDRKAITDWMNHVGTNDRAKALLDKLPELKTGACILYSPQWLERLDVVEVTKKVTFNASATPDFDSIEARQELAPLDLTALRGKLDTAIVQISENDPKLLKKRVAELEAKLLSQPQTENSRLAIRDLDEHIVKRDRRIAGLEEDTAKMAEENSDLRAENRRLRVTIENAESEVLDAAERLTIAARALSSRGPMEQPKHITAAPRSRPYVEPNKREAVCDSSSDLSRMERKILTILAQHRNGLTKRQIQTHTGYAQSGKLSSAYARLERDGLTRTDGVVRITVTGEHALGSFDRLPQGEALFRHLMTGGKLSVMQKRVLAAVHAKHPHDISKGDVGRAAGYAQSGKLSSAYASLTTMGYLVKTGSGRVRIGEELVG